MTYDTLAHIVRFYSITHVFEGRTGRPDESVLRK